MVALHMVAQWFDVTADRERDEERRPRAPFAGMDGLRCMVHV